MIIRQRVAAAAAAILAMIALFPLAARIIGGAALRARGRRGAVAVQAAALTPAAAVASIAAVGLGAAAAWWLAALLAVPAAVLVAGQLPRRRPGGQRGERGEPGAGTGMLRVLTLNALVGRADPAAVVAAVAAGDIDVLAVQELTPELAAGLAAAGLGSLLPHAHADPRPRVPGAGLWARWPLCPLPATAGLDLAAPSARLTLPSGAAVTVRAVHIVAPMRGLHQTWQADLRALRAALAAASGTQVVAGDFNASRDHRPFRDLLDAGYADAADIARRRSWPALTWRGRRWIPPVMRLDHVLVSAGVTVREARTVTVPGTDHLGVLAALEIPAP